MCVSGQTTCLGGTFGSPSNQGARSWARPRALERRVVALGTWHCYLCLQPHHWCVLISGPSCRMFVCVCLCSTSTLFPFPVRAFCSETGPGYRLWAFLHAHASPPPAWCPVAAVGRPLAVILCPSLHVLNVLRQNSSPVDLSGYPHGVMACVSLRCARQRAPYVCVWVYLHLPRVPPLQSRLQEHPSVDVPAPSSAAVPRLQCSRRTCSVPTPSHLCLERGGSTPRAPHTLCVFSSACADKTCPAGSRWQRPPVPPACLTAPVLRTPVRPQTLCLSATRSLCTQSLPVLCPFMSLSCQCSVPVTQPPTHPRIRSPRVCGLAGGSVPLVRAPPILVTHTP